MKKKWLNAYLNLFFCMALSVLSSSVLLCNHFKFSSKKISNGSSPVSAPLFIFSFSSPPAAVFESQYEVLVLSLRNVYSHVFHLLTPKMKKMSFSSSTNIQFFILEQFLKGEIQKKAYKLIWLLFFEFFIDCFEFFSKRWI